MGTRDVEVMVRRREGFCHLNDARRKNIVIAREAKQSSLWRGKAGLLKETRRRIKQGAHEGRPYAMSIP